MAAAAALGIDRLLADPERWLSGDRVALLANQASLTSGHRPTASALKAELGARLVALFTPEHGASGFEDDATDVPDGFDPRTGLPLHSLYGPRRRPDAAMLRELDAVVVDLRDVGVRCYTYAASVALLLESAREAGTEVIVCDRPSLLPPRIDGPMLEPDCRSFLAYLDVPFQHGLTLGELMRFHAGNMGAAPLRVVEVEGWRRGDADRAGFVPPSPGLPSPAAVALYPGLVALEGTGLSEGRGTPLPFQLVGGPDVDGDALAHELNTRGLRGVWARPLRFRPDSGKLTGRRCEGVQLHPTDLAALRPLEVGAAALGALHSAGTAPTRCPGRTTPMPASPGTSRSRGGWWTRCWATPASARWWRGRSRSATRPPGGRRGTRRSWRRPHRRCCTTRRRPGRPRAGRGPDRVEARPRTPDRARRTVHARTSAVSRRRRPRARSAAAPSRGGSRPPRAR
ncbi:MAG: DUF1343 domain-containing protein [Deinococcales bacterium]